MILTKNLLAIIISVTIVAAIAISVGIYFVTKKDNKIVETTAVPSTTQSISPSPTQLSQPGLALIGYNNLLYNSSLDGSLIQVTEDTNKYSKIIQLQDKRFLLIDEQYYLLIKDNIESLPMNVPNSELKFKDIIQIKDGSFVFIKNSDSKLYTLPLSALTEYAEPIPVDTNTYRKIIQLNDGSFVCIGVNNILYTKASLNTSPSIVFFDYGTITDIIQLKDNSFVICVGTNIIYVGQTLNDAVSFGIEFDINISSIMQLLDDSFISIGANGMYKIPCLELDPDSGILLDNCKPIQINDTVFKKVIEYK